LEKPVEDHSPQAYTEIGSSHKGCAYWCFIQIYSWALAEPEQHPWIIEDRFHASSLIAFRIKRIDRRSHCVASI